MKKERYYHRNKGPKGFSQRYLRKLYDDPEVEKRGSHFDFKYSDIDIDIFWNPYDERNYPWHYEHFRGNYTEDGYWIWRWEEAEWDDIDSYKMSVLLREIVRLDDNPFRLVEDKIKSKWNLAYEYYPIIADEIQSNTSQIESHLHTHISKIMEFTKQNLNSLIVEIRESIGSIRNLEVINHVGELYQSKTLAKTLCLFAPFWIRSPQTWKTEMGTNIMDHLFTQYKVPRFLYNEWIKDEEELSFKWLGWFIILGQGGSLKTASEYFKWRIPSKFNFYLAETPSNVSPKVATIYAEVKRLGGSENDIRRILANPAFVIDPTEISGYDSHSAFWEETVCWLIKHNNEITDEQSYLILTWAMHEYTERKWNEARPFSWKGRSLGRVLELSNEYHRLISTPWLNLKWKKYGLNWEIEENPLSLWSFFELTSGLELFNEGEALHHCVSSYAGKCASGFSAIVSLRKNGVPCITIELEPMTKQIIQVRGFCNRQENKEERRIISLWLKNIVMH